MGWSRPLPKIKKCGTHPTQLLPAAKGCRDSTRHGGAPFAFQFRSLDVAQLRVLMRFTSTDNQLYANMMMERLRAFSEGRVAQIRGFSRRYHRILDLRVLLPSQPLQRPSLLDELIAESAVNSEKVHQLGNSLNEAYGALKLNELMEPGTW